MTTQLIGSRIKAVREELKLSQDDLARLFGFKDRQTVSAIETGERRVSAEELLLAVEKLGKPLEFFTDPFRLVGEGRFSWRHNNVSTVHLNSYQRIAGRWIAAFRTIAPQVGRSAPLFRRALGLTRQSHFEEAMEAGERFAAEFDLGEVPALRLAEVMERELGILVLMVEPAGIHGISGAACRLPELDVVLINRNEPAGRRHFDLAHELFHIFTWDAMPPEYADEAREVGGNRVEQLANSFAGAVLMPRDLLARHGEWGGLSDEELILKLKAVAADMQVSASALKWRLVALGTLKRARARGIPDGTLRQSRRKDEAKPLLLSRPLMEVLGLAVDQGRLSLRRAADLLDLTIEDLSELFAAHGVEPPAEL